MNHSMKPPVMLPFPEKYAPRTLSGIKGQEINIKSLQKFVENFQKEKKKAVLLYGPPGTGKTSAAIALAHEYRYELIEVNASDYRTADEIHLKVGNALKQQSLFGKGKLILIDEMDGLAGSQDRGGIPAIAGLIAKSPYPIILTATDPWDYKFNPIRKLCAALEFSPLSHESVLSILHGVCVKENILLSKEDITILARRSGGDCRAALLDLQLLAAEASEMKLAKSGAMEMLGEREKAISIHQALLQIFKTTDLGTAISSFDRVKEDIDEQFLWVEENIPLEYSGGALAMAYDSLSKADVFRGRIRRWQHWRFLVYAGSLLSGGVALAKNSKSKVCAEYRPTGRILKLWWAKQKSAKKKSVAEKIGKKTHSSIKGTLRYVEFFKELARRDKSSAQRFQESFDLDSEELEWLSHR